MIASTIFFILFVYSLTTGFGFLIFASLFAVFFSLIAKDRDELIFSSICSLLSIVFLSFNFPQIEGVLAIGVSILAIASVPAITYYRKKLSVFKLSVICIFLSIISHVIFSKANSGSLLGTERFFIIVLLFLMFSFAVLGMVAKTFQRMVVYSNAVQFLFTLLDFEVGRMSGSITLQTIRMFEYLVTCIPFLAVMIVASREGDYKGILQKNSPLGLSFLISCLTMAGVPALAIFVSEFLLLSASMTVNKLLTLVIVFFVTLCFILYSSYIFPALIPSKKTLKTDKSILFFCVVSAIVSVVFGLFPTLQTDVIGALKW